MAHESSADGTAHNPRFPPLRMIIHPYGQFDNAAKAYQHIQALPLSAAMGAEIKSVKLDRISIPAFNEIKHALFHHKMIYFRDQPISHADQEEFAHRFGPFAEDAYTHGVDGHVHVQPVIKEADKRVAMIFGSGWHTDSPFLEKPPAISMLRGVDLPPYGGDTLWANTALAYDMLSDGMKALLAPLNIHMSMRNVLTQAQQVDIDDSPLGRLAATRDLTRLPDDLQKKLDGAVHPLVRTHPVTQQKSLYCDQTYSMGIDQMHEFEASPILNYLVNHITQPAFTCRLRWAPGTFAVWDNRLCLHQAFNDHDGFRREMYRTTIEGEVPI